jgi:aminopeptidase N
MKYTLLVLIALALNVSAQQHFCALSKQKQAKMLLGKTTDADQTRLLDQYDVTFHHLDLKVERNSTVISGNVRTLARVAAATLDSFAFELHRNLIIDSVTSLGNIVPVIRENDFAYAVLPGQLALNDVADITIYYHGDANVAGGAAIGSGFTSQNDTRWGEQVTWSLSQPYSAYEWWPCKQSLKDKIDSTYTFITTSNENKAGSQGLLQAVVPLPGNKVRYEWKSAYPIDYYLISVAVARYAEFKSWAHKGEGEEGPDSVMVLDYIYNNTSAINTLKPIFDQTAAMIRAFNSLFGTYPFANEKYGHCVAPLSGGMEHQTMTTIGAINFGVVAHELGHQWFGDNVTCSNWKDIWLNEGFATYCEYLAYQALQPQNAAQEMFSNHAQVMQLPGGSIAFTDETNVGRIFDSRLTYAKGGAFAHILRYITDNDSVFFDFLKSYQQQYKHATASTTDFQTLLEFKTGKDFSQIFDQWFYGEGFPTYNVGWNQLDDTLYIRSIQGTSSSATPLFTTPVEFKIVTTQLDTIVQVLYDKNEKWFRIPMSKQVVSLQVDPNNWIINSSSVSKDVTITGFGEISHVQRLNVYPNPSAGKLIIEDAAFATHIKISDITGKLVMEGQFNGTSADVSQLHQGVYIIELSNTQERGVARFVKN